MGDLGWRWKTGEAWRRSQEISTLKVLQMNPCLWKESK